MTGLRYSERNLLEAVEAGKIATSAEIRYVLERLERYRDKAHTATAALEAIKRHYEMPAGETWDTAYNEVCQIAIDALEGDDE